MCFGFYYLFGRTLNQNEIRFSIVLAVSKCMNPTSMDFIFYFVYSDYSDIKQKDPFFLATYLTEYLHLESD